jgi:predicted transcriptional regulator of viral defense system
VGGGKWWSFPGERALQLRKWEDWRLGQLIGSQNEQIFAHCEIIMAYLLFKEFESTFADHPVVTWAEMRLHFPDISRRTLVSWIANGQVLRIRNGFYRLADRAITAHDRFAIANGIYSPSYVSVRAALGFYGFIPEGVFHVESVSSLPSKRFLFNNTWYSYRRVKPSFFFGYRFIEQNGVRVMMATPEKTILDVLYLQPEVDTIEDFEAWRFDQTGILNAINKDRMNDYLAVVASRTLTRRYQRFNKWLHDLH